MEGDLGWVPQRPAGFYMASISPTLFLELRFWLGTPPPPTPTCLPSWAFSLLTVFLPLEQTPASAQARQNLPLWGEVRGCRLRSVTCQAVLPSPVCLCNYFCKKKNVLSVVATPCP